MQIIKSFLRLLKFSQPAQWLKLLSPKQRFSILLIVVALILILLPVVVYSLLHIAKTEAAWFDNNWSFRKAIPVTSTEGATQNNVFISFTLDTATPISTGKMQGNCQDIRITDANGNLLKYHIGRTTTCNNAATTIDALVPSFPNGQSTYYVYYGNPSAKSNDAGMYLSNIVTGSGNEITDGTRSIGLSGDFRPVPDSSYGIWEARTNILPYSEQLNSWNGKTGISVNSDVIAAPNGTTTADKVVEDTSTGPHVIAATGISGGSGVNITASVYAKAGERTIISIGANNGGNNKFDLSSGTQIAGTTGTITPVGNGWYRLTSNFNTGGGQGAYYVLCDGSGNVSYTGDGASGLYLWGAQVEKNTFASPYIPTPSSGSATRNAAKVQAPASLLNANQGWVAMRMRYGSASATTPRMALYLGSGSNRLSWLDYSDGAMYQQAADPTNGFSQSAFANTFAKDGLATYVMKWSAGSMAISINGGAFISYASGKTLTTIDTVTIGSDPGSGNPTDSDILWTVGGTGTLTDTDAANINNFGNTDPTPNSSFGANANMSFVWNANYMEALSYTIGTLAAEEAGAAPVVYFKFDEGYGTSTIDSSSNKVTGTFSANPSWKDESQCVTGKCLYFDGSNTANNQTVLFNESSSSPQNITGDMTISAWIKPTSNYYDTAEAIVRNGQGADLVYSMFYDATNQKPYMQWYDGAFKSVNGINNSVPLNKWSHVEFVRSGTNLSIYVNGNLSTTGTVTAPTVKAGQFAIGRTNNVAVPQDYTGFIDDLKVYSYSRTATQVKADFNSRGSQISAGNVLGVSAYSNLTNGLVGYWKMDEATWSGTLNEVIDSSGNGNNGQAQGPVNSKAYPSTSSAEFGSAGQFDGIDNYVTLGTPLSTTTRTLSVWVKPTATAGSARSGILGENMQTRIDYGNGLGSTSFHALILLTSGSPNYVEISTGSVSINTWNLLTLTVDDKNGIASLYLNGVLASTTTWNKSTTSVATPGAQYLSYVNNGNSFAGALDDARIYNRALSQTEIEQLYNWGPAPVLNYNFEEGQGSAVNDISGNGNSGAWNGTGGHWTQGKYGEAANFNGTNDYIRSTQPILTGAGAATISFWMNIPVQSSNWRRMLADATVNGINLFFDSNGTDGLYGTIGNLSSQHWIMLNPNLTGGWHYITITVSNSDGKENSYLDGKFVYGVALGFLQMNLQDLFVGSSTNPSYFLKGSMDDLKIYNYVRTQKQIVSDMNAGHSSVGSPVGSAVGYWKFDEGFGPTAHNSGNLGSALDGTITAALWKNDGKFGKALSFDGNTSEVVVPTFTYEVNQQYTLSFWTKYSGGQATYLSKATSWNNGFKFWNSASTMSFRAGDGTNVYDFGITTGATNNKWFHVAVVRNGPTWYFYIDGQLKSTQTHADIGDTNNSSVLKIGAYDAWDPEFQGMLDEVKIYNYALSSSEVKIDYNHGAALVLGAMSDTSLVTGGSVASNSASAAYCVPGDNSTCNSPVGEWNFEEGQGTTVNDTSGNNNYGTWNGTLGSQWTQGKIGKGGVFNGSDNYLTVNNGNLDTISSSVTISAWIYIKGYNAANRSTIITRRSGTSGLNFDVSGATEVNGSGRIEVLEAGSGIVQGTKVLSKNQWYHVAAILNGTNVTLYVNGSLDNTGTLTWTWPANTVNIGAYAAGSVYYFNGIIDNLRIYNYPRTAAQIAWDYNRGGPVGWWKFDECQGTTAYDSSGNGNNGTITIGATVPQTTAGTCLTPTDGTGAWYNGAVGKYNSSLNFDGADDYVTFSNSAILQLSTGTVTGWIKTSNAGSGYRGIIVKQGAYGIFLNSNQFGLYDWNAGTFRNTNASLNDGQWHFVAASFQSGVGNGTVLYIDGAPRLTTTMTVSYQTTCLALASGACGVSQIFTGQIDDARVYNYPLTQSQIQQVYNQGASVRFAPITGTP